MVKPFGPSRLSLIKLLVQVRLTRARSTLDRSGGVLAPVGGRPAMPWPAGHGLWPFCLIFSHFVPGYKYSPKLVELVSVVSSRHINLLKYEECWWLKPFDNSRQHAPLPELC